MSFGSVLLGLFGKTDIVIIDSAAGIGNDALEAMKHADETIIVSNLEHSALTDALRTINAAEELGSSVIGVILNKVGKNNLKMSLRDVEIMLGKRVIAEVPDDKNMAKALSIGQPILHSRPNSPSSAEFRNLANILNDVK